jgi:hypothetical protein
MKKVAKETRDEHLFVGISITFTTSLKTKNRAETITFNISLLEAE